MTPVKRWGPWGLLVAVLVIALGVGVGHSSSTGTSLDARAQHIAGLVSCPVCHGESAAQSQAAVSVQIRTEIRQELQAGETQSQILAGFVRSYGPGILEQPRASGLGLVVWVVPILGVLAGSAGLTLAFRRWGSRRSEDELRPVPAAAASTRPGIAETTSAARGTAAAPAQPAAADQPLPVADQPTPVADQATPVADQATPVADQPTPVADQPTPVADRPGTDPSRPGRGSGPSAGDSSRPARPGRGRRMVAAGAGAVLVAGGATWALVNATSSRSAGQTATGQQQVGPQQLAADLQSAADDVNRSDPVDALKQYQKVLATDPSQFEALTGEGWLLAQTGEPSLVTEGLGDLAAAERSNPQYAPAHLYRGIALMSEDDYGDAAPELQWYLSHSPDPSLVSQVQKLLTEARTAPAAPSTTAPAAPSTTTPAGSTARPGAA